MNTIFFECEQFSNASNHSPIMRARGGCWSLQRQMVVARLQGANLGKVSPERLRVSLAVAEVSEELMNAVLSEGSLEDGELGLAVVEGSHGWVSEAAHSKGLFQGRLRSCLLQSSLLHK